MSEYKEVTDSVTVPPHAGVEGFLAALRKVLRQPRVTQIVIDVQGKVSFTRYARVEEPRNNIEVNFDSVAPSALVRNADVQELDVFDHQDNAAVCVALMFSMASLDHMYPVAFVTGAKTVFYEWHRKTTGVRTTSDHIYGLPLHRDRFIPDEALLLVTAYMPGGSLVDVQKSYKIAMPARSMPLAEKAIIELPQVIPGHSDDVLIASDVPKNDEVKVMP